MTPLPLPYTDRQGSTPRLEPLVDALDRACRDYQPIFAAVQDAYRARTISDPEYLRVRGHYNALIAAWNEAAASASPV